MKKRAYSDIVWGILFFLFSIFMFWESTLTRSGYGWSKYSNVFWPRIILSILLLLSFVLIFRGIRKLQTAKQNKTSTETRSTDFDTEIVWGKMIGVGIVYIGYILLLPWFGFILATPFFVVLNMKTLGENNLVRIIPVALITTTVFVLLFGRIIGVDLPRGIYFLKTFSRFIY